jgi:site-specific DNA-methyltransferase (adenine-specific)
VSYVGKTKAALTIENDAAADLPALLAAAFAATAPALARSARFYVATPPGSLATDFRIALRNAGWRLHQALVWKKSSMVLGHSDYHYQHEDVLYGFLPGEGRPGRGKHAGTRWYGDHAQTSVFDIDKPGRNGDHPTTKPPELIRPMIANSSRKGDVVLDIFAGSGSTLVAAESEARLCYAMEIDPGYCGVILERLAGMGLEPRLAMEPAHA